MSESRELAPARCAGCSTLSKARQLGETPPEWSRGNDSPGDSTQGHYWCPSCSLRARLAAFERLTALAHDWRNSDEWVGSCFRAIVGRAALSLSPAPDGQERP